MTTKRARSWFLTDSGRNLSFAAITGAGVGCAVARYGPNTFFLQKYKEFVHNYNNGTPVELSQELKNRVTKCLDTLNIAAVQRKLIEPFSVFGYDQFYAGSMNSKFGVALGIPVNFSYKSIEDLKKEDIKVNQKSIDWSSEVGKKLADALILPEKVQEFAICRDIMMTQNNKIIYESIYPFGCFFMAYNMAQFINKKLNLYAAPLLIRSVMYSIIGTFGLGTYFLMKDMTEVHYESSADKRLCELGPEYVESGKIFYEKILSRNQALRQLMGNEGERKYSKLGNENFGLRQPRLALVHRKQFFEEKLKEMSGIKTEEETS